MTSYYSKNRPTLSDFKIKSLVAKFKTTLVVKGVSHTFLTSYPIVILHFGRGEILHLLTELLIGRKAYSMG
jgi:hypothetical protein